MSSTTHEAQIELTFTDSSKRVYRMPEVDEQNITSVASRIREINASLAGGQDLDFKNTFVSNSGATVVKISAGTIVTTTEEVLYHAS